MPFVVPGQQPQFGAQPPALPDGVRQNLQPQQQQQPMVEARPAVPYPQERRPYNPMRRQMPQYGIPQDQSRRGYGIDMSFMNRPMPGQMNIGPQQPQQFVQSPMQTTTMASPYGGYGRGRQPRMSNGRNY